MNIFLTADNHLLHENIISHCKRPFNDVDHMTEVLVSNWNSTATKYDVVYVLGDFSSNVRKEELPKLEKILNSLNGQKILIKGNHDDKKTTKFKGWGAVKDYHEIKYNKRRYCMSHYPFRSWRGSHKDENSSIHTFGHCHGSLRDPEPYSYDVGVDCWNFQLVPIDTLERMFHEDYKKNNP